MTKDFKFEDFISELGGGTFQEKIAGQICETALATIEHGGGKKKGKIVIELSLFQVGDNEQIMVSHSLKHQTPTKRGHKTETNETDTAMFVGRGGVMTISPPKEDNNGQFELENQSEGVHPFRGNNRG